MPRRSADEPRPAASAPAHPTTADQGGIRSYPAHVPPAKGKTSMRGLLRGLSSRVSVADMVRLEADRAQRAAQRQAAAQGKDPDRARKDGAAARAAAIKEGARRAGVSPVTARRWARGVQKASPKTEKASRARVLRSMGGAKGLRAAQIETTTQVDMGKVRVSVSSGGTPKIETRSIGKTHIDPETASEIGKLIRAGDEQGASDLFEDHILTKYGVGGTAQLSNGFMSIIEVGETEWI